MPPEKRSPVWTAGPGRASTGSQAHRTSSCGDSNLYGYALADPVNLVDPEGTKFSISLKSVGHAISSVVPGSVSNGALSILNFATGGAATDIACNGLNWENGVLLGVNLLPGGGRLAGAGGRVAVSLARKAAARRKLSNILVNVHARGSTAEAVLREAATGQMTGNRYHFVKAVESARGLNKLIESGHLSGRDLEMAINERDQLLAALHVAGIR